MKNSARITVAHLIATRLAAIGAANIPANARQLIEDQIWTAVAALIQRRISAPVVGRAVAHALAAPADTGQGLKGGTPLTSSAGRTPSAQPRVAGRVTDSQIIEATGATTGGNQLPTGGGL